jgi:phenylacetic acid degradation operon negative regulatory protein
VVSTVSPTSDDENVQSVQKAHGGSSPQHVLATLLGDYWLECPHSLRSVTLVEFLEEFGFSAAAGRTALSRLRRRGLIEVSKIGRHTFYRNSATTAQRFVDRVNRVMRFGVDEQWDGYWTVVTFSMREDQRDARHVLRHKLRSLGFASLYDAVWVAPRADAVATCGLIAEFGDGVSVMRAADTGAGHGMRSLLGAWDLERIRSIYADFLRDCERTLRELRSGGLNPSNALVARTFVMDVYRDIANLDPGLPDELMPSGWPRKEARAAMIELYDGLAPLAELRVRQIIARTSPELAPFASAYTTPASIA